MLLTVDVDRKIALPYMVVLGSKTKYVFGLVIDDIEC